ncbi:MAG: glycosyltransferase family 4 protein [Saprospiraceae bacterium]|nr:glycosyltransferase family 4 protein [Saprospiraceae bacterium]
MTSPPKKLTIALVANSTWNIYNFRLNLIDRFLAEGHDVVVIAPVDEYISYKESYPQVRHFGLRFLDRDSTNPLKDILLILELMRRYRKIKPDLVLHFTNKPNIYGGIAACLAGVRSVAVVTGLGYAFIHRGWITRIISLLYSIASRCHRKFIFENIEDRELLESLGIVGKDRAVSVKGCGVNTRYFTPVKHSQNGKVVFTFIGRLLYDKGIREYVAAARKMRSVTSNAEFWIVGELDPENPATVDKDELLQWVENDIVYYHGFVKDVRPLIAQSDCIVLPSYREAIPRTITEGMAMAKPVITTDSAGCREAVDEGVNGYLTKVKNIDSLVQAMKHFMALDGEQRHSMGLAGREKACREFDDKLIADHIYRIISETTLS